MDCFGLFSCMSITGSGAGSNDLEVEVQPVLEEPVTVNSATDLSGESQTVEDSFLPRTSQDCNSNVTSTKSVSSSPPSPPPTALAAAPSDACLLDLMVEALTRLTKKPSVTELNAVLQLPALSDNDSDSKVVALLRPAKSVTVVPKETFPTEDVSKEDTPKEDVTKEELQIILTNEKFVPASSSRAPSGTYLLDVVKSIRHKPMESESFTELDIDLPARRNQTTFATCERLGRKASKLYYFTGSSACNVNAATSFMNYPVLPSKPLVVHNLPLDKSVPRKLKSHVQFNIKVVPRGEEWIYVEYSCCEDGVEAFTVDGQLARVIPNFVEDQVDPDMSDCKAFFRNAAYILNNYETQAWINGVSIELPRIVKHRVKVASITIEPFEVVLDIKALLNLKKEHSSKQIKIEGTDIFSFKDRRFEMVVHNDSNNGKISSMNLEIATINLIGNGMMKITLPSPAQYRDTEPLQDFY